MKALQEIRCPRHKTMAKHKLCSALIMAMMVCSAPAYAQRNDAPQAYSIAAGDLASALDQLASQSKVQIIYPSELVRGKRASAIAGQQTWRDALQKLMSGTGLEWGFVNDTTVVIRKSKSTQNGAPTGERRESSGESKEQVTELERMTVTGTRIRRDPDEVSASPVSVFDRQAIERTGAASMSDFIGYITQGSSPVTNRVVSDAQTGRTTVNLRNLGNNTTLVLIDGRRTTRTERGFGLDDYDFDAIPLSAIERVEVLTNSAGAIYGADAIGGVINIITRQDYTGAELTMRYGNTFDSDVSERNLNLIVGKHGQAFNGRQYSVTFNVTASEQNALEALDRPYAALSDYSASGGFPSSPLNPCDTRPSGAGLVSLRPCPRPGDILPGFDVGQLVIPSGQDGRNLSLSDFDPSATTGSVLAEQPNYSFLLPPSSQRSASVKGKIGLGDETELFFDTAYSQRKTHGIGLPPSLVSAIPVPANNPFNPFGVDVYIRKVFYELGPSRTDVDNKNTRLAVGIRGDSLFGSNDWGYEVSGGYDQSVSNVDRPTPERILFAPFAYQAPEGEEEVWVTPPGYALLQETDPSRALNLFGDGRTTVPNDLALMRSLLGRDASEERNNLISMSFSADGTLAHLPGGDAKLAFGAEYRKERVEFYQVAETGRLYVGLTEFQPEASVTKQQNSTAIFAELAVPVVGEHQNVPGVELLNLNIAWRFDRFSLVDDAEELTPKISLLWKPFGALAVRASYGRGFKPPGLLPMFVQGNCSLGFVSGLIDPVTGNVVELIEICSGGNPYLKSERSASWSAGFVYEPNWAKGLSISADYFDIAYKDRVISPQINPQIVIDVYPERVTRDPVTSEITSIDISPANLNSTKARGVDLKALYRTQQTTYGTFDAAVNYTYNITNTEEGPPGSPVFERVDDTVPRIKANATLFWEFHGYELGTAVTYESSTKNIIADYGFLPERVRRAVVFDLQGSIDFQRAQLFGASPDWLQGWKLSAGIQNLFDRKPSPTNGDGGWAKIDPRQRRFYVSLRKSF